MNDVVSVIVPVYRSEKYLKKCLDSIIRQTYKKLEIILVDDGSDDDSGRICDTYASLDDRIRVFHIENGGVSRARNYGIEKSTGRWITFVDSDDYILDDHIKILTDAVRDGKVQLGVTNLEYITEQGNRITDDIIPVERKGLLSREQALEDMGNGISVWGYSWIKLFDRDLIIKEHIRFDEDIKVWEDMVFCARYLSKCTNIFVWDECTYIYVRHQGTAVTNSSYKIKKTKLTAMLRMEEISEEMVKDGILSDGSVFSNWVRCVLAKTCLDDITAQMKSGEYNRESIRERVKIARSYRRYLIPKNKLKLFLFTVFPDLTNLLIMKQHKMTVSDL